MKKYVLLLLFCLITLSGLAVFDYVRFYDGKLHITFCNVGQGDAIFMRTPSGKTILYDGGPDKSVLACVAHHSPFWQQTIDVVFLSHPHEDHYSGIYYLLDRYRFTSFATEELKNKTAGFETLMDKIEKNHIPTKYLFAGDAFSFRDGLTFTVHGPDRAYLQKTSPHGVIGESGEFASLIIAVSYGKFNLLLTGDSQVDGLQQVLKSFGHTVDVLHVPHHGSRFGLDEKIVRYLHPTLAVISVGKNTYGHPNKGIISLLNEVQSQVLRTDKVGDIEIVSDGKVWKIK